ncbi:MAG: MBOAT family O-acyltransferase [Eubacteriales bacterium]|nr:MBOAT family O-acyltransferase [Eubacteriales bacterium]
MVFSSIDFLFKFLPCFLLIYALCPGKWKNHCILAGSLAFYLYGVRRTPQYLLLFVISLFLNYKMGFWIGRCPAEKRRRRRLAAGVCLNLLCLIAFKYMDFLIGIANGAAAALGASFRIPAVGLPLPLGISFFTFQAIGWLADVYRREIRQESDSAASFVRFGVWMSMWPHVSSGPILRWTDQRPELFRRTVDGASVENGLRELTIGLGLKVLLANQLSGLWEKVTAVGFESISTPLAWLGILAYTLQIYFDFYGYSLMAIGLGELLGFRLPDNFRYPYMARSMTEFWRRWHMTLGAWFRDYVYIPLGGSRCSRWKTLRNLLAVWLLTGLWHGAGWNFLLWGVALFLLIAVEKLFLHRILDRLPALGHFYMLLAVPLSWLVFAVPDLGQIWIYLQRMFPFLAPAGRFVWFAGDYIKYGRMYWIPLLAGVLFITPLPRKIYERWKDHPLSAAALLLVFWFSIYCIRMGQNDPFLYFSF